MREAANQKLIKKYEEWLEQLKLSAPFMFTEKYSNPDYMSIPSRWFEATAPRIMVVGEERFGEWGNGKGQEPPVTATDITMIQMLHQNYLQEQLGVEEADMNTSAFWRRFRRVSEHGICCWTNIDKFHVLGTKDCALPNTVRNGIHSVETKILREEIEILKPTHVVFFGWHRESLMHELPDLYKVLYPGGKNDGSVWKDNVVPIQQNGIVYIFAYHPNRRSKAYEDKVIEVLQNYL